MEKCYLTDKMKALSFVVYATAMVLTLGVALFASLIPDLSNFMIPDGPDHTLFTRYPGVDKFSASISASPSIRSVKRASDTATEALASMHMAVEMGEAGKYDKAMKLFQHAMALDAKIPEILNAYGEFLEHRQDDVVNAEHMYTRAITCQEDEVHVKALANRKRTLPLVEEIDQINFNNIDKKRDMLFQVPDSHPGLRRMKQESYFQHIHHTVAIEGNTFTLMETRTLVETRLAIGGKSIYEHNEILGLDAALSFLNSTLLQRIGEITVKDILDIHKRVLGFVDPLEAGNFRNTQVYIGDFVPPSASNVERLVEEFVEWLNADDTLALHPIEHAALAHYKLVVIHPFFDGNGRTSRLLMNLIIMQAGYPPVIIRKSEKLEYYEKIQQANEGDVRPFIRFISRCTERTLDEFLSASSANFNSSRAALDLDDERIIILEPSEP